MSTLEHTIWPNGVLAVALALYVIWNKKIAATLIALITYSTLHFALAVWLFFTSSNYPLLIDRMHQEPIAIVRVWGVVFMVFLLGLLVWRYRFQAKSWFVQPHNQKLLWGIVAFIVLIFAGFAVKSWSSGQISLLMVKDILSMVSMVLLAGLFAIAFMQEDQKDWDRILRHVLAATFILTVSVAVVAVLELNSGEAWALFELSDGTRVERASSFLFSPNVAGLWCAAVGILSAYCYSRSLSRNLAVITLVLSGITLLTSGSRSSLILYLLMVAVIWGHRVRHGRLQFNVLLPPTIFLGSLASVGAAASLLNWWLSSLPHGVSALSVLASRMLQFPFDVVTYGLQRLGISVSGLSFPVKKESTGESIEGRFTGEIPDNGYLAVLEFSGWIGFVAWIGFLMWIGWLGYRHIWRNSSLADGYIFAVVVGCVLSGTFIRSFQVFPVWVFVSLGLTALFTGILNRNRVFPKTDLRHSKEH